MPAKRTLAIAVVLGIGCQLTARVAIATKAEVKACLAALETSYSFAKQQNLIEQRAQLLRCSDTQCPSEVRTECVRKVDEVSRAIPTVIFHVTDSAGNDLSNVRVTMDGTLFASQQTGDAMPLNPGKHRFVFEVDGLAPVQKDFVILTAHKDRREDITIGPIADPHTPTQSIEPAQRPEPNSHPTTTVPVAQVAKEQPSGTAGSASAGDGSSLWPNRRTWSIISGAVGVVGIGIGTAMAISAKHTASNADCDANDLCSQAGTNDRNKAIHRANWSMLPTGIGIAALGTGLVLWFVKPSPIGEARPIAGLSLTPDQVIMAGRF